MAPDPPTLSFNELQTAVKEASAFRCRVRLQADGGDGGKVFPPTYAGGVYAVENRRIDDRVVRCVLLDSVQSQANRMEEVLLDAFLPNWREMPTDGQGPMCELPVVAVHVENHGWVTSLTAPHRIHDAILRDSEIEEAKKGQAGQVGEQKKDEQANEKKRFRESDIGRAVVNARHWNATAFYRYCPTALLFGTWDSTAGEGLDSAKVPRAVVSEIIGVDITPGVRTGSRIDPLGIKKQAATTIYRLKDHEQDWTLNENEAAESVTKKGEARKKKFGKGKPSDINHGNVPPDLARFEETDQKLRRLPDVLESHPLKLRLDVETDGGRLDSHTFLEGETVHIRDGAVKPGGVTLHYALHTWTLSLTQLRRLRFPANGEGRASAEETAGTKKPAEQKTKGQAENPLDRNEAAQTVLAALGLYAFALLRERGCWLRSRCELIPQTEGEGCPAVLELIKVDGTTNKFVIPKAEAAKKLLREACEAANKTFAETEKKESKNATDSTATQSPESVEHQPNTDGVDTAKLPNPGWDQRIIRLTPTEKLSELVRRSDAMTADTETEEQEAPSAGNPS